MSSATRGAESERKMLMEAMERRMGEMIEQFAKKQEGKIEGKLEGIMKAIATISLQNQQYMQNSEVGEGSGKKKEIAVDLNDVREDLGRSTRYEFPKFDGEGFEGWVMRSEFFFEVAKVPFKDRVRVAAIHFEGKALQWHRGFASLQGEAAYADWNCYIAALGARFGAHAYEDPLADLRNLKQKGTLQLYMDQFDEIYPRTGIREDQALSFFLSGLVDELQMPVRMFRPKCLAEAYSLAKLQELTVRALGGKSKANHNVGQGASSYYSQSKPLVVTSTNYKPSGNVNAGGGRDNGRAGGARNHHNLTPEEMDEKRARNECFWCKERFTPNHHCTKRRSYVMQMLGDETEVKEDEEGEQVEEESEDELNLQLSLHAVWGREGPQIMRMKGLCQKKVLKILIDTGSTHNFLSSRVAGKIKGQFVQVPPRAVEVANGQLLQCTQKSSTFQWEMQSFKFTTEVYVIQLETYDLILGGQWLSTLGEIKWDFSKLSMVFLLNGEEVKLLGEDWPVKSEQLHQLHVCKQNDTDDHEHKMSLLMPTAEGEFGSCYGLH
ncbi:uncharacterized protein LOC121799175 [Salvia splendens]|uniref:uncharacterized protein LOC121799175 n=1 Tax=Salvia splendens TaxID=180675 RepID=UPI001C25BBBA|nr:uncharacterized protein LOC121799175 [Salvia splendens]